MNDPTYVKPNDDIPADSRVARSMARIGRLGKAIEKEQSGKKNPGRIKSLQEEVVHHFAVLETMGIDLKSLGIK